MGFYLLKEDGGKILLENGSGALLLEASTVPGPTVDWQAGGAGHPFRRKKRDELFDEIEHALEVALGIVEEPLDVSAAAVVEEAAQPKWSEEQYRAAIRELGRVSEEYGEVSQRFTRLEALFRAYEEAQARERALQDDEEAWFLLT